MSVEAKREENKAGNSKLRLNLYSWMTDSILCARNIMSVLKICAPSHVSGTKIRQIYIALLSVLMAGSTKQKHSAFTYM